MSVEKIVHPGGLRAWLQQRGETGPVAVVTGTYDILQPGNLRVLAMAQTQAAAVLVILETDEQARRHADAGPPRNALAHRMEMISNLRNVTGVTWGGRDLFQGSIASGQPLIWVVGERDANCDEMGQRLLQEGAIRVTVANLPGCSTEEVRCAIRENRTPVLLPGGMYDSVLPVRGLPSRGGRVTVNGCFDILHIGHIRFLARARAMGDSLTVLMNDDASVARYKGLTRPIFPLSFRRAALLAFERVDEVQPFGGDNPLELMAQLRPDIHVKGGSFEESRVKSERELMESWGGRLECTPMEDGFSTSNYIRGVLQLEG